MARGRQSREENAAEENISMDDKIGRMKAEAIKRGKQRLSRGGSLESFNKRLEVDLPSLRELFPGWAFRWVLEPNVPNKRAMGYELVPYDPRIGIGEDSVDGNTDVGGHVSIITKGEKGGVRQYLMMIPEEIHSDIKKMKQAANDEIDRAIHQMKNGEGDTPVANKYVPDDGGSKYRK